MQTVDRRWTVATWLVAGAGGRHDAIVQALEPLRADIVCLQVIGEDDAQQLAAALGLQHAWELSHYPRSRLIPGSAVGLAVLAPHAISASQAVVCNGHSSTWSAQRRITQFAAVNRADHSGYLVAQTVGPSQLSAPPAGGMARIDVHPEQAGVNASLAIVLPGAATAVEQ